MDEAARELAARRKLAREAAAWAFENGVCTRKALKEAQFAGRGLTINMVQPLLAELKHAKPKKRNDAPRDHPDQILTNAERLKLGTWILACADGQDPKDRTAVSNKVRELLRARHADNKRRKWGTGCIKLNTQELRAVNSRELLLSKSFFERFYPCGAAPTGSRSRRVRSARRTSNEPSR